MRRPASAGEPTVFSKLDYCMSATQTKSIPAKFSDEVRAFIHTFLDNNAAIFASAEFSASLG